MGFSPRGGASRSDGILREGAVPWTEINGTATPSLREAKDLGVAAAETMRGRIPATTKRCARTQRKWLGNVSVWSAEHRSARGNAQVFKPSNARRAGVMRPLSTNRIGTERPSPHRTEELPQGRGPDPGFPAGPQLGANAPPSGTAADRSEPGLAQYALRSSGALLAGQGLTHEWGKIREKSLAALASLNAISS